MGHASLGVLPLLLLTSLCCRGQTRDVVLTLKPNWSRFFIGEYVTFKCETKEEDDEQQHQLIKDGQGFAQFTKEYIFPLQHTGNSGRYQCSGQHQSTTSNTINLIVSADKPRAKLTAAVTTIPAGGSVTLSCSVDNSGGWKYDWFRRQSDSYRPVTPRPDEDSSITKVSEGGDYACRGRRGESPFYSYESDRVTVGITYSNSATASLQLDWGQIFRKQIPVRCEIQGGGGIQWYYVWMPICSTTVSQHWTDTNQWIIRLHESSCRSIMCKGVNSRDHLSSTKWSEAVRLTESRAVLTLEPNWSTFFRGETVTFKCDMKAEEEWEYVLIEDGRQIASDNQYTKSSLSTKDTGRYQCFGLNKRTNHIKTSDTIQVTVSSKPKAHLWAGDETIPAGGSVTLSCSVNLSSGWKYYWYRGGGPSELLTSHGRQTSISQAGLYRCRGGRGDPLYFTDYSDSVTINNIVENKVVVTLHPNWPQIFSKETITLRCEIRDRGDAEWEYEWKTPTATRSSNLDETRIRSASPRDSGDYRCRGRIKSDLTSTEWSDAVTLRVSDNKPVPVVSASPSWLSPGASVALNCSVEAPSSGWSFYWFQVVPDGSHTRDYRYELLPGVNTGTGQSSSIVRGQTHTAGYVCRAGRGEAKYYSDYSKPTFVWSGDLHGSASLTVTPNRVQHFTSESVSLSCEGNATEWRVWGFIPEHGILSSCSYWRTSTTCKIQGVENPTAVYWCESGSGLFSNAVNITVHDGDMILLSPALPVTQGTSVSLGCMLRMKNVLSNVFFYKNDQMVQNGTRVELNISAVSASDQGFYRCEAKAPTWRNWQGRTPQSWMSVELVPAPEASSFPVPVIVGLICGILLITILVLWYCFRKSKDSWADRSARTNHRAATDHMTNQDTSRHNNRPHGESKDVTYAVVEFKSTVNKKKNNKPTESSIYSEVKVESAAGTEDVTIYDQVKKTKT